MRKDKRNRARKMRRETDKHWQQRKNEREKLTSAKRDVRIKSYKFVRPGWDKPATPDKECERARESEIEREM